MNNTRRYPIVGPAVLGVVLAAGIASGQAQVTLPLPPPAPAKNVPSGQEFFKGATFVGAQTCQKCHARQYDEWTQTWHSKMERFPSPQTVVGDFRDVTLIFRNIEVDSAKGGKERITATVRLTARDGKYSFTLVDKDTEANNQTHEVAKTLGGKWDQHYEAKVGDNYFPTPMRWSAQTREWLTGGFRPGDWFLGDGTPDGRPRKPNELKLDRAAEAKCAMCHTTGYTPAFDKEAKRWKAAGPFELGISCEKCHGPGSLHVKEAADAEVAGQKMFMVRPGKIIHPLKDLNMVQQVQVCTQCHGRNTNKKEKDLAFPVGFLPGDTNIQDLIYFWTYSGDPNPDHFRYFWPNDWAKRNRQQWQDYQKSAHFTKGNVTCLTCHTFHGQWAEAQLRLPREQLCATCHTATGIAKRPNAELYADSPMAKAGVTCSDCHMAKIGYRTTATPKTPQHWDTSSHTFMVATPEMTLRYGLRSACDACHTPGKEREKAIPLVPAAADAMLRGRQVQIRGLLDTAQQAIRAADAALARGRIAGAPAGKLDAAAARRAEAVDRPNLILLDGSMGFHNGNRAEALLNEARALALEAERSLASP
jgi:predicted CXXCH cytochrome family protein